MGLEPSRREGPPTGPEAPSNASFRTLLGRVLGRASDRGNGIAGSRGEDDGALLGCRGGDDPIKGAGMNGVRDGERCRAGGAPTRSPVLPAGTPQLLVGTSGDLTEARVRVGHGVLAGTELALSVVAGSRHVEATLLTCTAGSRETLTQVMEEIRRRLRGKGIVLSRAARREPEASADGSAGRASKASMEREKSA